MTSEKTKRDLESGNVRERHLAAKKLVEEMKTGSGKLLLNRLHVEKDPSVLEWLCIGAGSYYASEAAERLVQLLKTSTGDVRGFACEALGRVGSEKCVPRLQSAASYDNDHDVRLSAMKALVEISIRLPKAAPQIIQALEIVEEANTRVRSGDLSRAAVVARREVEKAVAKAKAKEQELTLFGPSPEMPLPTETSEGTKAKDVDKIGQYLRGHDVAPEEVRYIMEVVRRPIRHKNFKKLAKKEGIEACQICDLPFLPMESGDLYCQMAHVKALKDKGMDAAQNLLFLCSNCHAALDMAKHTQKEWKDDILIITLPNQAPASFRVEEGRVPKRIH